MIFVILQIILAILLITFILLQMQGTGLTTAFGGTGDFHRSKRSVEKLLMYATIAAAVLFAGTSIVLLLFPH